MDFKKKEAIRNKEFMKRKLLIKNKDEIIKVKVINITNESMNLQNLNLLTEIQGEIHEDDPTKGNRLYKQYIIFIIFQKNNFNYRNTRN